MITRTRLKNWKSHMDSDMEFSAGVNVLIGVMGSGKTSIVDAISFALFGTFPGLKSRRLELNNLIMKKPEKKQDCQVELDFVVDGKKYYVKRVVNRDKGTGHAEIRRDGELLNVNAKHVTDEVVRALQMDYDMFSKAVYSEQNGLDYFLRIPKGKRMDEIDRMLKVDRFEKVRTEAVSLRNKVKGRREERVRLLADMEREGIQEKITTTKSEIKKMESESVLMNVQLEIVKKDLANVSEKVMNAENSVRELNDARISLEGIKSSQSATEESILMIRKRLDEKSIEQIANEMKEKAEAIAKDKKVIETRETEIEQKREEMASVMNKIELCNDGSAGLERAGAKCPVCDSEITDEKRKELFESRQREKTELEKKTKAIAKDMGSMTVLKRKMEDSVKTMELYVEKLKGLKENFKELDVMDKKRTELDKQRNETEEKIIVLEKKFNETEIEQLRKQEQEFVAKQSSIAEKVAGINTRISDKKIVLDEMIERKKSMEKYKTETERDEEIMESMASFEKVLKITQDQLREEFLKTVNSIMADVWNELYPYGDFQDIRLAIDGDYVLQLKEAGGWISVEGTISGGERSMAALALRIAFSMAFTPNLKWLILDEPTHNLDSNAIRQFASILREKMGLFAEQVFLITHEERITEGVTGSLYRMERDKGKDEPTRIVSI